MMKHLLAAFIWGLSLFGASAQTPMSQAGLYNQAITTIPDNTSQQVTPSDVRNMFLNTIASVPGLYQKQINLISFGAQCDGGTDDTSAIQEWLNTVSSNVSLVAPAGVCLFSSALTIPWANNYSIIGAGEAVTRFVYTGGNTTNDIVTVSDTGHGWSKGVQFANFTIDSNTQMTAGFAFHAHGLAASSLSNVVMGARPGAPTLTKLAGGFWFDGAAGVYTYGLAGVGRGLLDGVRVNSALGGAGDLFLNSPNFSWFSNGLHMAGGFGGFQCDGTGDIIHNGTNLLIDNSVTGTANLDFSKNGGCAFDGAYTGDGVVINDTQTAGGFPIFLNGWLGASWYQSTVDIEACLNCFVYMNSIVASLSCQDGIYIQDQTVKLSISVGSQIRGNGATGVVHAGFPLGNGTCTTAGGRGWGINSTAPDANVYTTVVPVTNAAGLYNNIAGLSGLPIGPMTFDAVGGVLLQGSGSSFDLSLRNNVGNSALVIPTGQKFIGLNRALASSGLPSCTSGLEGSLAYVNDTHKLAVCNGSTWNQFP